MITRWKPLLCMIFLVMGGIPEFSVQAQSLAQYQPMLTSPDAKNRMTALQAFEAPDIVLFTEPAVLKALIQASHDKDKEVRREAVRILALKRNMAALPTLLTALQDTDEIVKLLAANGLALLPSPLAVSALLKTLQDNLQGGGLSEDMKNVVIRSLGVLGDASAIPALIKMLQPPQEPSDKVKITAFIALGQLRAKAAVSTLIQMPMATPETTFYALQLLGQLGDPASVPTLIQALYNDSEEVRFIAVEALGKIGTPSATLALVRMLRDSSLNVRLFAIEALGRLGSGTALIHALQDESEFIRYYAAKALGEIGDPAAVPALIKALQDESSSVIYYVVEALVRLDRGPDRSQAIVHALIAQVKSSQSSDALTSDYLAKSYAAEALGKLGNASAIPVLIQVLDTIDSETADTTLIASAAKALGELKATASIPVLIKVLRKGPESVRTNTTEALLSLSDHASVSAALLELLHDDSESARYAAAEALGELGDTAAVPALIQSLQDESVYVRSHTASALGLLGDPVAVPALTQALQDESIAISYAAANALGKIGDTAAVPALIQRLNSEIVGENDEISMLKQIVIMSLGRLGDPQAVEPLIQQLKTKDPRVRAQTVTALGALRDPAAIPALLEVLTHQPQKQEWEPWGDAYDLIGVAQSLAQLKDNTGLPILLSALQTTPIKSPPPLKHYLSESDFFTLQPPEAPAVPDRVSIMDAIYIDIVKSVGILGDASAVPVLQSLAKRSSNPLQEQIEITVKQLQK